MLALLSEVLRDDLVGAYLYGSVVMGGLTPSSDLDVLAVSRRPTTPEERERLASRLLEVSGRPRRSVELTVVVDSELRQGVPAPTMEFQYGDWLRDDMASGRVVPPAPNPDLLVLFELARGSTAVRWWGRHSPTCSPPLRVTIWSRRWSPASTACWAIWRTTRATSCSPWRGSG